MFGLGTAKDCRRRAKRVRGNKRGQSALSRMHERLELRLALTAAHGDFNGDGYMDLAIGVPGEDVGAIVDAGAVNVIYGSGFGLQHGGLAVIPPQVWHQDTVGIFEVAETGDRFGEVLGVGDFNDDGYDDLAVGVPHEDVARLDASVHADAGLVHIIYGSAAGLTATGNVFVVQQRTVGLGVTPDDLVEAGDWFGFSLATGDYNGDGIDDLAIGSPGEDIGGEGGGSKIEAGAVGIVLGSGSGITATGAQFFDQDSLPAPVVAEAGDHFGWSLAAADFTSADGIDDLAVGIPGEDVGAVVDAGMIQVLKGSALGVGLSGNQLWHQGSVGMAAIDLAGETNILETGDNFGYSLVAADFSGDGRPDLAIGTPGEDFTTAAGPQTDAGVVNVLYNAGTFLNTVGTVFVRQNATPGGLDDAETGDKFGQVLSAGDFDGDGVDDLVVGVPLEDLFSGAGLTVDAGVVEIVFGSPGVGLVAAGAQQFAQSTPGILGLEGSEAGDLFGAAVAPGDYNGDGVDDLAIGSPGEDANFAALADVGVVNVLYGSGGLGLSVLDQLFTQFALETAEAGDGMGAALT
jgi:hypothetical protein